MIVAPGLLPDERRRLEWWQYAAGSRAAVRAAGGPEPGQPGFLRLRRRGLVQRPAAHRPAAHRRALCRCARHRSLPVDLHRAGRGGRHVPRRVGADVPVSRFERSCCGVAGVKARGGVEVTIINYAWPGGDVELRARTQRRSGVATIDSGRLDRPGRPARRALAVAVVDPRRDLRVRIALLSGRQRQPARRSIHGQCGVQRLPTTADLRGDLVEASDQRIENPAFVGGPSVIITRMVEENDYR